MELQMCDSKKLFKVFDASTRKRSRKKREEPDDANSVGTDDSNNNVSRAASRKASLQNTSADIVDVENKGSATRGSTTSIPQEDHHTSRRHRRLTRDGLSLALKAGMVSTPRSNSPPTAGDGGNSVPTQENDSIIYAFLEEAIKRDKKKHHRHGRRYEERRSSHEHARDRDRTRDRDREASGSHERRRRHHRHRDEQPSRERDRHRKEESPMRELNQTALLETFAKLCAQMNENCRAANNNTISAQRTHSHKSLQCEVLSRRDLKCDRHPERLVPHEQTHGDISLTRIQSQSNCRNSRSREKVDLEAYQSRYDPEPKDYEKEKFIARTDYDAKYSSTIDVNPSRVIANRMHEDERYRGYPPENVATRTCIGSYRDRQRDRECREFERRQCEDDRRRYLEQKTSRSFEVHRDSYVDERCKRTSRSDTKDKRYDNKYYEKPIEVMRQFPKDRSRRYMERYDRHSVTSREDCRERDRYSERERDSGLSVADGDASTLSGRTGKSHYMRAVKQEIAEQREAMDKMMKLWKELMRCFKGISNTNDKDKAMNESACENVRESAAAQLRLWRECMRRYETVARDVGDTDARLMEEINKQRSEMTEMATMWQECLQRYRDMSDEFNTLKQQLATAESPTRLPAAAAPSLTASPVVCSEGESPLPAQYRLPQHYPQVPGGLVPGYQGSPLRGRASAPPAWWWGGEHPAARQRSSRRSSPESRDGRDSGRRTTHRNKDSRETSRYKEKSSKPSAARSEHRHRKR